jgi:hypothetical protein
LISLAVALSLTGVTLAAAANSEADYKAALAAAETANKQAGALKNQWTTTAETLKAAQKAAAAHDYNEATALAKQAEALAKASVAQAHEQEDAWKAAASIVQ